MGPVWEANHVWLIFVIVVLFTCFPYGYARLGHRAVPPVPPGAGGDHAPRGGVRLSGLRPTARPDDGHVPGRTAGVRWGTVFGVASVISPFLLGLAFGVVTEGGCGSTRRGPCRPMSVRALAQPLCPRAAGCWPSRPVRYLAAVYLTVETDGELREDFRRRAIVCGTTTAATGPRWCSLLAWHEASWFFRQLIGPRSWPVLAAGLCCFAASAWAVFGRRYRLSRVFAAGEIVLLLLGWGLAQHPYLVYPDITLQRGGGPRPDDRFPADHPAVRRPCPGSHRSGCCSTCSRRRGPRADLALLRFGA